MEIQSELLHGGEFVLLKCPLGRTCAAPDAANVAYDPVNEFKLTHQHTFFGAILDTSVGGKLSPGHTSRLGSPKG